MGHDLSQINLNALGTADERTFSPHRRGFFKLAKDIHDIFLCDIIDSVEGMEQLNDCVLGFNECSCSNPCAMHDDWIIIREKLTLFLLIKPNCRIWNLTRYYDISFFVIICYSEVVYNSQL